MSGLFKEAHSVMLSSGLLSYWTSKEMITAAKGVIDIGVGGSSSILDKNPDAYRQTGESIGDTIGSSAMIAANAMFMFDEAKRHGLGHGLLSTRYKSYEAIEAKTLDGVVYKEMVGGHGFLPIGKTGEKLGGLGHFFRGAAVAEDAGALAMGMKTAKEMKKGLAGTLVNGNKFYKGLGPIAGIAPIAAAFAVGQLSRGILGFVGGLVDEAVNENRRFQHISYDTRFFNNQQDEMTNYQTLGLGMQNYNTKLTSTSRIYHAR